MRYQPRTETAATVFGAQEQGDFSIAVNGKMFNTLIAGLYQNKIESIVRESCANAFDGHTKRGNVETPFLVHAPTMLEPWYSVRDYGCSMDHEMVMKLYTTLGWSSKEESDTMVGCFGLGSKSPFAYAETFTVTTFLDGVKRIYICYMDDNDWPKIILSDTLDTDEEQGVEISVPVREPDFPAFRRSIQRVAVGYDVMFETVGVNVTPIKYNSRSETYDVVSRTGNQHYLIDGVLPLGPYARVGVVLYPIDHMNSSVQEAIAARNPDLARFVGTQTMGDVIVNIPISVASVTPSREFLSYTKEMIDVIVDVYETIFAGLQKEVADLYEGCETKWDYAVRYRKISYGGKKSLSLYAQANAGNFATKFGSVHSLLNVNRSGGYYSKNYQRAAGIYRFRKDSGVENASTRTVERGIDAVVIIGRTDKIPSYAAQRVAQYLKKNNIKNGFVVRTYNPNDAIKKYAETYSKQHAGTTRDKRKTHMAQMRENYVEEVKGIQEFIDEYDCPRVVYEWDLPYEKEEPVKKPEQIKSFAIYRTVGGDFQEMYTGNFIAMGNEKAVVIPMTRRAYPNWKGSSAFTTRMFAAGGVPCTTVIGVAESNLPAMKKLFPHWIMLEDALKALDLTKLGDIFEVSLNHERGSDLVAANNDVARLIRSYQDVPKDKFIGLSTEIVDQLDKFTKLFLALQALVTTLRNKRSAADLNVNGRDVKDFLDLLRCHGIDPSTIEDTAKAKAPVEISEAAEFFGRFRKVYPEMDMLARRFGTYDFTTCGAPEVLAAYLTGRVNLPVCTLEVTPEPVEAPKEEEVETVTVSEESTTEIEISLP